MSKKYSHIKQYEKEILGLKNQGLTQREIAEKCKSFGKQLTIEPLKANRRFTKEFFGNSEPITPVS